MAIAEQSRTDWLDRRRTIIGASESPAILGCGYANESAWTVWAKKTGLIEEQPDNELLWYGREIQPITMRAFTRKTGLEVQDLGEFTIQIHPEIPWLGCTLDGLCDTPEGRAVVEAKNIGHYASRDWNEEEPPLKVQVQVQHQLAVTGLAIGFAVATVDGHKCVPIRIERNERFIGILIDRLAEFQKCVETKTPPPVDGSQATARILQKLHADDTGEIVSLPEEAEQWERDRAGAKEKLKELKALIDDRENRIKAAIGKATFGRLSDGRQIAWKTVEAKGYEVGPKKYRRLGDFK